MPSPALLIALNRSDHGLARREAGVQTIDPLLPRTVPDCKAESILLYEPAPVVRLPRVSGASGTMVGRF
jgi:hypothetical protein